MSALSKYLSLYAEPEASGLGGLPGDFTQGLVIPIYKECPTVLEEFCQFASQQGKTLLVIVLNRPDSDEDKHWMGAWITHPQLSASNLLWQSEQHCLRCYRLTNHSAVLIIDRGWHGPAIPVDQGVGLARKIGADILCQLIEQDKVHSPWIANTDADALLPEQYFWSLPNGKTEEKLAACLFPFQHISADDTPVLATLLYEFSLHYYVNGLRFAGSHYAYHTIGSILSVHYQHYAQVRGFPKRAGAEDFYLLNKLAKTGEIRSLPSPTIHIKARHSDRVPFGTGPATGSINQLQDPGNLQLYHPDCFVYLREFIVLLEQLCTQAVPLEEAISSLSCDADIEKAHLGELAAYLQLAKAVRHCYKQGKTFAARQQHMRQWFDGFKTLKAVHWLRDNVKNNVSVSELLAQHSNHMSLQHANIAARVERVAIWLADPVSPPQ